MRKQRVSQEASSAGLKKKSVLRWLCGDLRELVKRHGKCEPPFRSFLHLNMRKEDLTQMMNILEEKT